MLDKDREDIIAEVKWIRYRASQLRLQAPDEFWSMKILDLVAIVGRGGCGPTSWGDYVVPDKVLGADLHPACLIHDYEYSLLDKLKIDARHEERIRIDYRFYQNCKIIVEKSSSNRITKWARLKMVDGYFDGVRLGGEGYES